MDNKLDLPALRPMARAGAVEKGRLLDFPTTGEEPPHPTAPAGNVVSFPKRTVAVCIRVPPELNDSLQRSADRLLMTKASYAMRVLHQHEESQQYLRNHCERRRVAR